MFDIFKKLEKFKKREIKLGPAQYIVAGLGNPGLQYEKSRHNAGFMAVDYIASQNKTQLKRFKFKSYFAECEINDKKVILLKPQTFMNNSGKALIEAMSFYKLKPSNLIVICDDIYLPLGKLRIKRKGSHGGQNGMRDIIELLGTESFVRIKLGIGSKPNEDWDLSEWVLSKFSEEEKLKFETTLQNTYSAIKLILQGDTDKAMGEYN